MHLFSWQNILKEVPQTILYGSKPVYSSTRDEVTSFEYLSVHGALYKWSQHWRQIMTTGVKKRPAVHCTGSDVSIAIWIHKLFNSLFFFTKDPGLKISGILYGIKPLCFFFQRFVVFSFSLALYPRGSRGNHPRHFYYYYNYYPDPLELCRDMFNVQSVNLLFPKLVLVKTPMTFIP